MKTLKFISLLMFMTMFNSCFLLFMHQGEEAPHFSLALSFQDTSGKDLVKGMAYTPESEKGSLTGLVAVELYTMQTSNSDNTTLLLSHSLIYSESDSEDYSTLNFPGGSGINSRKDFTYLLICPHLFGDKEKHEIVAYCKEKKNKYICYRLTFDGNDIPVKESEGDVKATVVLN